MRDPDLLSGPDIAALRAAATAAAVAPGGARPGKPTGSAGVPIRWLVAVLAPALVLTAIGMALWPVGARRPSGAGPGGVEASVGSGPAAWVDTLTELDARRSLAFSAGDPRILSTVYAPGSAALATDTERLGQLTAAGMVARGLRLRVLDASVLATAPGTVVLRVSDRLEPYQLVAGDEVTERAGRATRSWLVTLVPAGTPLGEWRISSVVAA